MKANLITYKFPNLKKLIDVKMEYRTVIILDVNV